MELQWHRARELTHVFCDDVFDGFDRGERVKTVYVCFTDYDETIGNKRVAFEKESITNTFGEFLAAHGLKQARIAETEKYAHVTFFFNGGVEEPNQGEDRFLIPSPKEVATYDLKPEMSAPGVCDKLVESIGSGNYDVIIINFANPDMVGHTGVEAAAIQAIEAVDHCVGRTVEAVKNAGGVLRPGSHLQRIPPIQCRLFWSMQIREWGFGKAAVWLILLLP